MASARLWLRHPLAPWRKDPPRHYHQWSNVDPPFRMVKRKFGDSVRSKTPTAMANEVLAKLVCHNVVCCVHEMHELGIDPRFGPKGDGGADDGPGEAPRNILKFPGVR